MQQCDISGLKLTDKDMTIKSYKYIVQIKGVMNNMTFRTFEDALETIQMCMPCKATIEAMEEE